MVGDIAGLADGTGTLSVFTNEKGGIIDDTGTSLRLPAALASADQGCLQLPGGRASSSGARLPTGCACPLLFPKPSAVVTKVTPEELYIVVNAGCRDKDLAHIGQQLEAFKVRPAGGGAAALKAYPGTILWRLVLECSVNNQATAPVSRS